MCPWMFQCCCDMHTDIVMLLGQVETLSKVYKNLTGKAVTFLFPEEA